MTSEAINLAPPFRRLDAIDMMSAQDDGANTPILRYYGSLFWRWRTIIGAIVAVFLAGGVIITLLMTSQFMATSKIEIRRESAQIVNMQGVERDATDADQEFYQTQFGLLRAQSLAERVAEELRLADDPAFFDMFGADRNGTLFSDNGSPKPLASKARRLRSAGELLLDNLRISPQRQSRLVEINFTSPDPALSQRVANSWAEKFIQSNLERRYKSSAYARQFLEGRLGGLREKLNEF